MNCREYVSNGREPDSVPVTPIYTIESHEGMAKSMQARKAEYLALMGITALEHKRSLSCFKPQQGVDNRKHTKDIAAKYREERIAKKKATWDKRNKKS